MLACAARHLARAPARLRLVTCHLGGGASVAAIDRGRSVDTSMGMSPLERLIMGTRPGDLDPLLPLQLARWGMSLAEIDDLLSHRSGLAGISGLGGDLRVLEEAAHLGEPRARLAIDMFVQRLQRYIGGYAAELGGLDALVFTGGIGEGSSLVRARVCAHLGFMGIALDARRNDAAQPADHGGVVDIASRDALVRVLVVHAEEQLMIAREVVRCLGAEDRTGRVGADVRARRDARPRGRARRGAGARRRGAGR